jgi:outer membrane usher protein
MDRRVVSLARIPILAFALAVAAAPVRAPEADPLQPGNPLFANLIGYDFAARDARDPAAYGLLLDVTLSDGWGEIRSGVAARGADDRTSAVRLESAYTRDLRDEPLRVTFGDALMQGGDWAMPLRFGGITIEPSGRGGAMPRRAASPALAIENRLAATAGAADYLDALLPFASAVRRDPTAFDSPNIAIGSGEMSFAVREAPGVGELAAAPGRAGLKRMAEGQTDSRVQFGLLRDRYGVGSFDYGAPVAAITLRQGLTGDLTGETHGEVTPQTQAGGLGLFWAIGGADRLTVSGAASHGEAGTGALGRIALGREGDGWDAQLGYQMASERFLQPGWEDRADRVMEEARASGSIDLGDYGDLSLAYSLRERADDVRQEVASFVLDMPLLEQGNLAAVGALSRTDGSASIGLSFTIPLGGP